MALLTSSSDLVPRAALDVVAFVFGVDNVQFIFVVERAVSFRDNLVRNAMPLTRSAIAFGVGPCTTGGLVASILAVGNVLADVFFFD